MSFRKTFIAMTIYSAAAGFISCGDDDIEPEYAIPSTYVFERAGENTVSFSGQTTRILMAEELVSSMKTEDLTTEEIRQKFVNEGDNPFENAELNTSSKSVRSKVAASSDFFSSNVTEAAKIKADFDSWIEMQVVEVFPRWTELAEEGSAGQIADGSDARYISGKGLEYDQAFGKSLIGALMVDQILNNYLSPAVLDAGSNIENNDAGIVVDGQPYTDMEHKWDEAYGYLFGKSTNEATPLDDLGVDDFLNKYLARVEGSESFAGIAAEIFNAFKKGRAAIVAGAYDDRDRQADIIKSAISKVIAIRAVYYLQNGKLALEAFDFGGGFHDLSEGYGFIYSLRFTRKPGSTDSYFTSQEVDEFIATLEEGNGFWDIDGETLDSMSEEIADRFDFTVEEASK